MVLASRVSEVQAVPFCRRGLDRGSGRGFFALEQGPEVGGGHVLAALAVGELRCVVGDVGAGVRGRVLDAQPEMAVDDAVVGQEAELDVDLDDGQGGETPPLRILWRWRSGGGLVAR